MQNALRFEEKTKILPRFKKYVQFETIERGITSECYNIKTFEMMLFCQCIYMKPISLIAVKTINQKKSVEKYNILQWEYSFHLT